MSTLKVNQIQDTSGGTSNLKIDGAAKAWVNFNGTGTVAIRDDLNVSSITDNGTGDYTINFATAMANANYAVCASTGLNSTGNFWQTIYVNVQTNSPYTQAPTTSAFRICSSHGGVANNLDDNDRVNVSVFGD